MWTLPPVRALPLLSSPSRFKTPPLTHLLIGGRVGYENEDACKKAIETFCSTSSVPRSEIFYTTKLRAPTTYDHAIESIKYSVEHAPGGYVDLYLMHSAIGGAELREASWRAFEWAKKEGLVRSPLPSHLCFLVRELTEIRWDGMEQVRSIGVSNWGVKHIEEHVERVNDPSKPEIVTLPSLNQVRIPTLQILDSPSLSDFA